MFDQLVKKLQLLLHQVCISSLRRVLLQLKRQVELRRVGIPSACILVASTILGTGSLAQGLVGSEVVVAEAQSMKEIRSDRLRISFSIPTLLKAALTNGGATISILTQKEYEELLRSSKGKGSAHGAEDEATVTVIKPPPLSYGSALDNLYVIHDYLQREGYDIKTVRLGGVQAIGLKQEIKCCNGDPYVSRVIAAISPDRTFLVIVRGGRNPNLLRQIVSSFVFR